jgi:hypothetical protein
MTKAALDHGLACACHSSMSSPPLSRRALLAGAAAFGAASVGGTSSPSSRMLLASSVSRVGSSRYEPRRQFCREYRRDTAKKSPRDYQSMG